MPIQMQQPSSGECHVPLFQAGFRPFFLLAGILAVLQIPLWLLQVLNGVSLSLPYAPSLWHGHEMIFGFAGAAVAGFMLTAVPNWTGCVPLKGRSLAALAGLWLAARLAFALGGLAPPWVAAMLDLPFLPALAVALAIPLMRANKLHNTMFLLLLGLLTIADGLVLAETAGLAGTGRNGLYLGLFLLILMIGIVGGRIIPGFTQGGLRQMGIQIQPKSHPWLEKLAIGLLAAVALAEAAMPESPAAGVVCLAAALVHGLRLMGWQGWKTGRIPLLWVLHLGYLWLPLGLGLFGLASVMPGLLRPEQALHGLTVGAIGSMVLGVMSRAALGHSGRPLIPAKRTVVAFGLVAAAAWLRGFGPLADPVAALWLSALLWSAGFALYVTAYAPIFVGPRVDGKAG